MNLWLWCHLKSNRMILLESQNEQGMTLLLIPDGWAQLLVLYFQEVVLKLT